MSSPISQPHLDSIEPPPNPDYSPQSPHPGDSTDDPFAQLRRVISNHPEVPLSYEPNKGGLTEYPLIVVNGSLVHPSQYNKIFEEYDVRPPGCLHGLLSGEFTPCRVFKVPDTPDKNPGIRGCWIAFCKPCGFFMHLEKFVNKASAPGSQLPLVSPEKIFSRPPKKPSRSASSSSEPATRTSARKKAAAAPVTTRSQSSRSTRGSMAPPLPSSSSPIPSSSSFAELPSPTGLPSSQGSNFGSYPSSPLKNVVSSVSVTLPAGPIPLSIRQADPPKVESWVSSWINELARTNSTGGLSEEVFRSLWLMCKRCGMVRSRDSFCFHRCYPTTPGSETPAAKEMPDVAMALPPLTLPQANPSKDYPLTAPEVVVSLQGIEPWIGLPFDEFQKLWAQCTRCKIIRVDHKFEDHRCSPHLAEAVPLMTYPTD